MKARNPDERALWAVLFDEDPLCDDDDAEALEARSEALAQADHSCTQTQAAVLASHGTVPGLTHIKRFITADAETELLSHIHLGGFFKAPEANQAMLFGQLPPWALELSVNIQASGLLPAEVASRLPVFDQMILNLYRPGEGICPHVDLLTKYEDGIVSVSLGGPAVMRFEYVGEPPQRRGHLQHGEAGRNAPQQDSGQRGPEETQRGQDDTSQQCVLKGASRPWPEYTEVLLEGGDLLVLCGPARFCYSHGIDSVSHETFADGTPVVRGVRTSITLRRLLKDIVLSHDA